jgi:hypothetical protein
LHACFPRRADALLELGDALLCAQAVPSLPHLSLEPVHQRGWGSTYAALARGRIDAERLRDLLVSSLGVVFGEVVEELHGGLSSEGVVGPVVGVGVQPDREGIQAGLVAGIHPCIGPLQAEGGVEPLGLAGGLRPVGPGALVAGAGGGQDLLEGQ